MSRENFFVKANLVAKGKDDKKHEQIHINVSSIIALIPSGGGTNVVTSAEEFHCTQTPEYFIKAGAAYGVMREI